MASADPQKKLKEFIARRHPMYEETIVHWDFLECTYEGGRDWFQHNLFKYVKEGADEFEARRARAYRFNHTREVVDLVDKYLFKMEITRNLDEAPKSVIAFWKKATLNGAPVTEFMKRVSNRLSTFGRIWIAVDSTNEGGVRTVEDEKKSDARAYAYIVTPQHVLDMSYDNHGVLNWILIHEIYRDDEDPINSTGEERERFRLWTREFSQLFLKEKVGNKVTIQVEKEKFHNLGVVPLIAASNVISDDHYTSPALISDVAYLDRAIANYLSNIDAIVQDQTFSQLIMPAQGLAPGEDAYNKLVEMGTKRIFTYDAEHGEPKFISPDVKQSELILKIINKIINEIYHSVGLAGERTKEDNAQGIDNSSGVAKAYDFERVNSLLAAKADSLQMVENKVAWLVAKWHTQEAAVEKLEKGLTNYPDSFDVRGLLDEFEIAARLCLIEAPEAVRREQMTTLVSKLFPQLTETVKKDIDTEMKTWPPKPVLAEPGSSGSDVINKMGNNKLAAEILK